MLDEVRRRVDHARDQHVVVGDLVLLPRAPLVAVARVRGLEQQAPGLRLQHRRQHLRKSDVAHVRALVVAPAHVHADPVAGHVPQGVVQHLDVQLGPVHELVVGQVREHHVPAEPEIRAVELQHEPRGDDRLVLVAHRLGDVLEVGLVRRVVDGRLEQRDDARGGRVHEALLVAVRVHRRPHPADVGVQRLEILHLDRTDALRAAVGGRAAALGLTLEKAREALEILRRAARAVALEAREPVLDVGGVADLAHLAVGRDRDARGALLRQHVADRALDGVGEAGLVRPRPRARARTRAR